jgi:hypothetical protein
MALTPAEQLFQHQQAVRNQNDNNLGYFNVKSNWEPDAGLANKYARMVQPSYDSVLDNTRNWEADAGNVNLYGLVNNKVPTSVVKNSGVKITPERQAIMDQQRLLNQQLGTNLKIDGVMGPQTQKAMDMMQGRREADLARAVQTEAATMAPQQQVAAQPTVIPKQQGWGYNQAATDKMHQQWLNNELGEGQVPTAVYDAPEGGLAAKIAGWFK